MGHDHLRLHVALLHLAPVNLAPELRHALALDAAARARLDARGRLRVDVRLAVEEGLLVADGAAQRRLLAQQRGVGLGRLQRGAAGHTAAVESENANGNTNG